MYLKCSIFTIFNAFSKLLKNYDSCISFFLFIMFFNKYENRCNRFASQHKFAFFSTKKKFFEMH